MNWSRLVPGLNFWILGIGAGLISIHLTLTSRIHFSDLWGTSALFWAASCSLLWDKRSQLKTESGFFPSLLGALLLFLVLAKSSSIYGYDLFLRFFPLISALGFGLLVSGFKGLKQYWQELLLLSFIVIPPGLLLKFIDFGTLTAKFTAFILWYAGLAVSRQGLDLILPTGKVEVASGCTGAHAILQLLGISLVFLFMFPGTSRKQKIMLPLVAVAVAFVTNSLRVALMAILVAYSDRVAFDYWHSGTGSLIFSAIAVAIFGLFCWLTIMRNPPHEPDLSQPE